MEEGGSNIAIFYGCLKWKPVKPLNHPFPCRLWVKSIAPSKARRSLFRGATDEIALIRHRRHSNVGQLSRRHAAG